MTKETLIAEARKLPRDERHAIAEALWDAGEDDYELTEEEQAILDARWKNMQAHPETTMRYEDFKARLYAPVKR